MSSKSETEWDFVVAIVTAILGAVAICFLVGITTHETKVRNDDHNHAEILACIQSDRSAADCRLLVYGSK